MSAYTFMAVWPILDVATPRLQLIGEALQDVDRLAMQARAELQGPPEFSIRAGRSVPGSGGAEMVLVAEAPAVRRAQRDYRKTPATQGKTAPGNGKIRGEKTEPDRVRGDAAAGLLTQHPERSRSVG